MIDKERTEAKARILEQARKIGDEPPAGDELYSIADIDRRIQEILGEIDEATAEPVVVETKTPEVADAPQEVIAPAPVVPVDAPPVKAAFAVPEWEGYQLRFRLPDGSYSDYSPNLRGSSGSGAKGEPGQNFDADAFGDFVDRDAFDSEAEGFTYLSLDGDGDTITDAVLFFRVGAAPTWSSAILFRGPPGEDGEPGESGARTTGIEVFDFGAGADIVYQEVAAVGMLPGDYVNVRRSPIAATANHSVDEQIIEQFTVVAIPKTDAFDIVGHANGSHSVSGEFLVAWEY